jgi:hypothetical protein
MDAGAVPTFFWGGTGRQGGRMQRAIRLSHMGDRRDTDIAAN